MTSAGTFTSCKDYDDDINNLQEQIDKLATKEDMEAKLSQMQAAIDAAKATAEDALAKAEAAGDSEEIASLKSRIEALEKAAIDVEALKNEISTAVDSQLSTFRTEIEELLKEMEEKLGLTVADMVTSVELVLSYTSDQQNDNPTLDWMSIKQFENKFGPNKEIEFVKDQQTNFGGEIIVRVSPANAILTADMVSFINGKGESLSDYITVGEPKVYDEYLTRAAANTGLWKIPYSWKTIDNGLGDLSAIKDKGNILYAVAINNTPSIAENTRNVISTYDLAINEVKYTRATSLWFTVDGTKVSEITNRYNKPNKDQKWDNTIDGSDMIDPSKNTTDDSTDDNRASGKQYVSVKVGKAFDVVLDANEYYPTQSKNEHKPYRFYVTLDKDYAEQNSEPSEINAWNQYAKTMTGLNTLDTDGKVSLTINDATAEGDIIGFRVYAVNHDGTLVDPDGKAFYVYVGTAEVAAAELTIGAKFETPYDWTKFKSTEKDEFSTASWGRANGGTYTITYKEIGSETVPNLSLNCDNFEFYDKDNNVVEILTGSSINSGTLADDITKVTKVEMINVNPTELKDGVTYEATITVKATSGVVATGTIKFTKELPGYPSSVIYPYTNVLRDNVLYIYPIATNDKSGAKYDMTNVWHGLVGDKVIDEALFNQVVTDDKKKLQGEGKYPNIEYPVNTANKTTISVEAKYLDPDKSENSLYLAEFPMKSVYNYGNLSYINDNGTWKLTAWSPVGKEFNIVFRNYADDLSFAWNGEAPKLAYQGVVGATSYIALDKLNVTDWYNAAVNIVKGDAKFPKDHIQSIDVHFLTGENFTIEDEYYKGSIKAAVTEDKDKGIAGLPVRIELTEQSSAAQPNDVPTKLKFVITDCFGYTIVKVIDTPFTMTAKQN